MAATNDTTRDLVRAELHARTMLRVSRGAWRGGVGTREDNLVVHAWCAARRRAGEARPLARLGRSLRLAVLS